MKVLGTYNSSSENMKENGLCDQQKFLLGIYFRGKDQLYLGIHMLRALSIKIQSDLFALTYQFTS